MVAMYVLQTNEEVRVLVIGANAALRGRPATGFMTGNVPSVVQNLHPQIAHGGLSPAIPNEELVAKHFVAAKNNIVDSFKLGSVVALLRRSQVARRLGSQKMMADGDGFEL